jgi:hypothetical protein
VGRAIRRQPDVKQAAHRPREDHTKGRKNLLGLLRTGNQRDKPISDKQKTNAKMHNKQSRDGRIWNERMPSKQTSRFRTNGSKTGTSRTRDGSAVTKSEVRGRSVGKSRTGSYRAQKEGFRLSLGSPLVVLSFISECHPISPAHQFTSSRDHRFPPVTDTFSD